MFLINKNRMSITKNFSKDYPDLLFHYNTEKNEYSISKKNNDENESIETFLRKNNIRYTDLEEIFYNYHDKINNYYYTFINKITIKENDLNENIKSKLSVKDFIQKNKTDNNIEMTQNKKDEYTIFYKQKTNISIFNHDYNSLDELLEKIQKNFNISIIKQETNDYICSSHTGKQTKKNINTSFTFKLNELDTIVNNLNNNSINYNNKIQMKKEKQIDDVFIYTILFRGDSDKIYFFYKNEDYVLFHKNNDIYIINMKGESSQNFSINEYKKNEKNFLKELDIFLNNMNNSEKVNDFSSKYINILDKKIKKPSTNWDYVYETDDDFIRLSFNNFIDLESIVNKNRSVVMKPTGFVRKLKNNNNSINNSKKELMENFKDLLSLDF